ncbi:hypothetical protein AGMMS50262_18790 [Bacteroidia bacterium]|nr:hypothetical protein AGMMS50262_18790 [Bacteroidia bacterium]
MQRLSFFAALWILSFGLFAQDGNNELTEYIRTAQYQKAIEYIDGQEASRELLYQKARCYQSLNNYVQAIEILENLKQSYPDDVAISLDLALCYERTMQFQKGIHCYDKLIMLDTLNTYFRVRKADLLYRAEKYAAALDEYQQIPTENYNLSYLKRSVAMCYEKTNRADSARVYYAEAWQVDSTDIFSALSLVKMNIQQEDYISAVQHSETFLAHDTTNAQMNALNAFAYYHLNVYDEAAKRFEKCRAAGDSSLMVNRSLGISYFFLQKDTCAYPYLNQALTQDTTNMTVLYALSSVNYNLGNFTQAIEGYKKLVETALPNKNALYTYLMGLARSYEEDSVFIEAGRAYFLAKDYASTNNQKMELFFALAMLQEENLNDYQGAIFYYTQYRATLFNYQEALSEAEQPDAKKIEEVEYKLTELDKHIQALKEQQGVDYDNKIWR